MMFVTVGFREAAGFQEAIGVCSEASPTFLSKNLLSRKGAEIAA